MEESIKQSELRIGNFVIGYNKEVERIRVISVQTDISGSWHDVSFEGKHYYNYVGDLTPIRITEEWLNKFGFTIKEGWKSKSGFNYFREDRKVEVSMSPTYGIQIHLVDNDRPTYMIDYVHELQNIYQYLTGEELEYVE